METRARELTDFPRLFGCYWGAWKSDSIHTQPEIIANRNAFGRFLARGKVRKPCQTELLELALTYAGDEQMYANALDHLEYYRDSLGRYIQVCSEHGALNGDLHDKLVSEGWVVIKPMYYIGASTYARYIDMTVIKTKRDIIRVQREIDGLNQNLSHYRQTRYGPSPRDLVRMIETHRKRIEVLQSRICAQKQEERAAWLDEIRA